MKQKISIILPCYNGSKYLDLAINSILKQTHKNFILYLSNNGSVDDSLKIMERYKKVDKRIVIINYKKKTSQAKSINSITKLCKTKYIAFMDADDIMYSNRLESQLDYLIKNPDVKVLSCLARYIGSTGNQFGISTNNLKNHNSCFDLIKRSKNVGLLAPGVIIDRKVFLNIGGFNEKIWPCLDIDLWNRIAFEGNIVYSLPKVLMYYRIHDQSIITKEFLKSKLITLWLKHNLFRRNNNLKQITYKSYLIALKKESYFFKLKFFLKARSDYHFRKSLIYILGKNLLFFLINIFLSFLFNPSRFLKKTITRLNFTI